MLHIANASGDARGAFHVWRSEYSSVPIHHQLARACFPQPIVGDGTKDMNMY